MGVFGWELEGKNIGCVQGEKQGTLNRMGVESWREIKSN